VPVRSLASTAFAAADPSAERRADRAADAVLGGQVPASADLAPASASRPAALLPSVAARLDQLGPGAPAPPDVRTRFERHFDFDFGALRIHADSEAARLASALGARAFTLGSNVVFGEGQYRPHTDSGSRLLAHELAHVVQQHRAPSPILQLVPLSFWGDDDPLHDPSRLTDAQIESSDEYAIYMGSRHRPPLPAYTISPDDARLACRLLLRHMRERRESLPVTPAMLAQWLDVARGRNDVTGTAEGLVGHLQWVPASATDVTTPRSAASEFTRWMLASGSEPSARTGRMNCWEMVLLSAFRAGYISEGSLRGIYTRSVLAMRGRHGPMGFPRNLEQELRSGAEHTYNPAVANSPRPLRGDLVIFGEAATHVALATGRLIGGQVEVVSHWTAPDGDTHTKLTTIEALLPSTPVRVAKFWSPIW
jgi:hypothetical protein